MIKRVTGAPLQGTTGTGPRARAWIRSPYSADAHGSAHTAHEGRVAAARGVGRSTAQRVRPFLGADVRFQEYHAALDQVGPVDDAFGVAAVCARAGVELVRHAHCPSAVDMFSAAAACYAALQAPDGELDMGLWELMVLLSDDYLLSDPFRDPLADPDGFDADAERHGAHLQSLRTQCFPVQLSTSEYFRRGARALRMAVGNRLPLAALRMLMEVWPEGDEAMDAAIAAAPPAIAKVVRRDVAETTLACAIHRNDEHLQCTGIENTVIDFDNAIWLFQSADDADGLKRALQAKAAYLGRHGAELREMQPLAARALLQRAADISAQAGDPLRARRDAVRAQPPAQAEAELEECFQQLSMWLIGIIHKLEHWHLCIALSRIMDPTHVPSEVARADHAAGLVPLIQQSIVLATALLQEDAVVLSRALGAYVSHAVEGSPQALPAWMAYRAQCDAGVLRRSMELLHDLVPMVPQKIILDLPPYDFAELYDFMDACRFPRLRVVDADFES